MRRLRKGAFLLNAEDKTMMIDCLYCGERRPHSDEHILQRGLGGNLTFKDVCKPCNESFSMLDQALMESSVVALERLVQTPDTKRVTRANSELMYDPTLDLWKEVSIGNRLRPEILPQLHYRTGEVVFAGTEIQPLREFAAKLEELVVIGKVTEQRVIVDDACITPRIALRRAGRFIVRAPSSEAGVEFLAKLSTHWPEFRAALNNEPSVGLIEKPTVRGHLSQDLNQAYRAVAKSVFNYLAFRCGVLYARSSAFAPVREYIRGNTVGSKEVTDPCLVDVPFVKYASGNLNLMDTRAHCITIGLDDGVLYGLLTLYEHHTFIVRLGAFAGEFAPLAHEFAIDGTSNRQLSTQEMTARTRSSQLADEAKQRLDLAGGLLEKLRAAKSQLDVDLCLGALITETGAIVEHTLERLVVNGLTTVEAQQQFTKWEQRLSVDEHEAWQIVRYGKATESGHALESAEAALGVVRRLLAEYFILERRSDGVPLR